MDLPPEYRGREQTFFKHGILHEYVPVWAHKLGSAARRRQIKLWYGDVFAGPWNARDAKFHDTSICIGLRALIRARNTWAERGVNFELGAFFVEKDKAAYEELQVATDQFRDDVDLRLYLGTFAEHVGTIDGDIGTDSAFLFVDPCGWKGAALEHIKPLVRWKRRDVILRLDSAAYRFRERLAMFLGRDRAELLNCGNDNEFIEVYRRAFKEECGLKYAAQLAIPEARRSRKAFWLVGGGHHPDTMEVFRDAEAKVVGRIAGKVLRDLNSGGQLYLFDDPDPIYVHLRRWSQLEAPDALRTLLQGGRRVRYEHLWPQLLETLHLTKTELGQIISEMDDITIHGMQEQGKRRPAPGHLLQLKMLVERG